MGRSERIVIVGAGLAGLRSAERLRELGFSGELVIIGSEKVAPYHRPALSKQLLTGAMRPSDLMLPAYRDIGARWRLGTQAAYLLPRNRAIRLPGAEEISYDGLVIATGVEAKRPNDLPYWDPRIIMMRNMQDALDLERAMAAHRGPVAVVGGGFTGCEIAASLRHLGREVTIIGRSENLLGNVLGPQLGEWLTRTHREHGVDLALGNSVKSWQPGPDGVGLQLSDGSTMLAACVVVAAGTEPCTSWLRGSGLPLDNGVVCEATCHVVGAEDVVAAGDVAQWPNLRFDEVPRRVEHWLNAVEMGRAAAESLLAGRSGAQPFTPMPRFWTEQYGVRIQAGGVPKMGTDTISLGTPDAGTGTVIGYVRDGRLMGVVGVDCPASVLSWTETVCEQNPIPGQEAGEGQAAEPGPAIAAGGSRSVNKGKTGRHALPVDPKKSRSGRSSGRLRPVESTGSSGRLRPIDPPSRDKLRPLDPVSGEPRPSEPLSERMRPVEALNARLALVQQANGHAAAPAVLTGQPPVPVPSGQSRPVGPPSERMRPVGPPPGPPSERMRPLGPPPGANLAPVGPLSERMRPAGPPPGMNQPPSQPRMRPVGPPSGRMAPVEPPNGRGHPVGPPSTRMRPVDPPSGHLPPVGPPSTRMRPVDPPSGHLPPAGPPSRPRMPAVGPPSGRMGPVGPGNGPPPLDVTSLIPVLDEHGRPVGRPGGPDLTTHLPVLDTYGRPRTAPPSPPPPPDATSMIPVVDSQGRIKPVDPRRMQNQTRQG